MRLSSRKIGAFLFVSALAAPAVPLACIDFSAVSAGLMDGSASTTPEDSGAVDAGSTTETRDASPPGDDATLSGEAGKDTGTDSPPITCTEPLVACGGQCVDTTSDPNNCNGCGNVCTSGICGTKIAASMATKPGGWDFNGTAVYDSTTESAVLTAQGVANQAATVLYAAPVALDAFDAQFSFRMGYGGGGRGDGMAFVMEQDGPTAVGGVGGALALVGLSNGFAVELDTFNNQDCGDTSDDHVGVDSVASCAAASGQPTSLAAVDVTSQVDIADAQWHEAEITVNSGKITVTIDQAAVITNLAVTGIAPGPTYYLGVTGAVGALLLEDGGLNGYRQEFQNFTTTFPTPRCL
jgi:hypothetical protein